MEQISPAESRRAVFDAFEADLGSGDLRKHGLRLKLRGRPFEILGLLLERAGEVVTRDELRNALWSPDTFVDFDHGLNTAVNRLRETLGDNADSPRFIETLPRRGYRFLAPVRWEKGGNTTRAVEGQGPWGSAEAEEASPAARPMVLGGVSAPGRWSARGWALLGVMVVVLLAVLFGARTLFQP